MQYETQDTKVYIQNPTHQIYNPNPSSRKKNNIYKFLFLYTFGFLIAIISITFILNYFKVIDLNTIPPFSDFQKQESVQNAYLNNYKIQNTNEYVMEGKLINYNKNSITILPDQSNPITINYNINSKFYSYKIVSNSTKPDINSSITATQSTELLPTVEFPNYILNKNNIGKNLFAHFLILNNKYLLQELNIKE